MKKFITASLIAFTLILGTGGMAMAAPAAQTANTVTGNQIVNTALSYVGKVQYHWGTRDPQHLVFDCSSFTQYVYKLNGIYIGWGANAQTHYGTPVYSKAQLQPGDLVMLSLGTPGRIGHVGIYIGNGKIVHNVPHHGVVIGDLNTGYWKTRFVKGAHIAQ